MKKIIEKEFALNYLNKYGSQMTVGNGYLGVRGALEEEYPEQVRGMYVAGIYNRPSGSLSSELVNLPDVTRFQVMLDGENFFDASGESPCLRALFRYEYRRINSKNYLGK